MKAYKCAVFTENLCGIESLMEFNEVARANDCGFILAETLGVAGYTFVDFGDAHVMFDKDGEPTKQYIVTSVNKNEKNELVVTVHEDKRHSFQDGDWLKFTEIEGMTQLNYVERAEGGAETHLFKIKDCKAYQFTVECDATNFGDYERQGICEDVKTPHEIKF